MLKTSPNACSDSALAILLSWQKKLLNARQRGVLHLEVQQQQGLDLAEYICQKLGLLPLWVHREKPQSTNAIKQFIGQEHSAVVYNSYQHLSANHLALLAGTVQSGGLLVLITDTQQNTAHQVKAKGLLPGFVQYWFAAIAKSPVVASYKQQTGAWHWPLMHELPKAWCFNASEQQQAIAAIEKTVLGRARSPLLLLAKRGRGKSAALGIAAATLGLKHNKNIIITAPSERAITTLVKHFSDQAPSPVNYWPIDKLLAEQPACDAVFVDEAAAIPIAQLQRLTSHYNRVAFATTIDGYEGSGQGFLLRFKPFLEKYFTKWRSCSIHEAIRFSSNDGLERFIDNAFMLAAKVCVTPASDDLQQLNYQQVTLGALVGNTGLLKQVFALLGLAHYQTSADDLQFLLEQPKARLFIASQKEAVVGVLLTVDEGGFNLQEARALTKVPRRVPGHVLPQQLLAQGHSQALGLSYCRVIRIAVHPRWRRQNIASGLIHYMQRHSNVDVLGTSFSVTEAVLAFWQSLGFSLAMLGSKKSTASACYSAVFLKANNASAKALVQQSATHCQLSLQTQLLLYNQDMPAACLPLLFRQGQVQTTVEQVLQMTMYCEKRLGFEAAHIALAVQLRCYFQAGLVLSQQQLFLAEKLLLNVSFEQLTKRYGFSGRKAIEQAIREFFIARLEP